MPSAQFKKGTATLEKILEGLGPETETFSPASSEIMVSKSIL